MLLDGIYFNQDPANYKTTINPCLFDIEKRLKEPFNRPLEKQNQIAWQFLTTKENKTYYQTDRMVDKLTAIMLDFDNEKYSIQDAKNDYKEYMFYMYTSWSHKPSHNKFRIILPLANTIDYNKFQTTDIRDACKVFFKASDPTSFTHTRKMFMPYEGPFYEYYINKGEYFNIDRLSTTIEHIRIKNTMETTLKSLYIKPIYEGINWDLCEKELDAIVNLPDNSGRYGKILTWIGKWKTISKNENEIERIFRNSSYNELKNKQSLLKLIWRS